MGDESLQMPLGCDSTEAVRSLRFLLKKAFDFGWLFAFLSIVTKVMWDAADPGDRGGFRSCFAVVAS